MQTSVEIRKLDNGEDVSAGYIIWDGYSFQTDPPQSILLTNILREPTYNPENQAAVNSWDDPVSWLSFLQFQYRSAYLRAMQPVTN